MIGGPSSIAIRPGTGRFFLLGRVNASIRSAIELFWPMIGDPSSIAFRPGTGRFFLLGRANASIRSILLLMTCDSLNLMNKLFRLMIDVDHLSPLDRIGRLFY